MQLTPEQEAHLYTIDADVAARTKMIRDFMEVSYEKALQLMEEYGAKLYIDTDILEGGDDGAAQMSIFGGDDA